MSAARTCPLTAWLENEFTVERQEVQIMLEVKHQLFIASLKQKLDGEMFHYHPSEIANSMGLEHQKNGEQVELQEEVHEAELKGGQYEQKELYQSESYDASPIPIETKSHLIGKSFTLVGWGNDNEPPKQVCRWLPPVDSAKFELAFGLVIVFNTVMVAIEMQYNGTDVGYSYGYDESTSPTSERFPDSGTTFEIANVVCNLVFTFELAVRLLATRWHALVSSSIWLDVIIVFLAWLEMINVVKVNTSIIRIFRLARTIRVVKILRAMHMFRVLYFMIRSLVAGLEALIWSFIVIACIQVCSGLICCQMLAEFVQDETQNMEDRKRVFKAFGTFSRTMFTMFAISDGNWVAPANTLMDAVNPWWGLYIILYRCVLFYAIGKVIAAVFIAETQRLVERDQSLQAVKKRDKSQEFQASALQMFEALDMSGDHLISRPELEIMSKKPEIANFAKHLDLDSSHWDDLFDLLESHDGNIHIEKFVRALPKLKGNASSLEVSTSIGILRQLAEDVRFLKSHWLLPTLTSSKTEYAI